MAVVADPRPVMAIIPDVPLVDAGENWPLITDGVENGTFTSDDIAAAIGALADPSIRSPRIKLGHSAKAAKLLGDGLGTWGRVPELWTTNEGMTLTGHFVGVPVWLAAIMPWAWADRSVEGRRNVTSETGRTHALVIDAVSLLGDAFPAISTLDEVRAVWCARSLEELPFTLKEPDMPIAAARKAVTVAASTTTEDIRRAYYDDQPANSYTWIREIELDPLTLIVDDDEGGLWRVPVTVAGDAVTFGAPAAVHVEYVPVAAGATTSASREGGEAIVFASRDESLQGVALDPKELRKSMGLAETATDAEVLARAAELAARPEAPAGDPVLDAPATPPAPAPTVAEVPPVATAPPATDNDDGSVRISQAALEQLQVDAALGVAASRRQAKDDEDGFIARHRARLGPASNPKAGRLEASWRREYQRNPGEAEALAASHAVVMPTSPLGHDEGAEETAGDGAWTESELRNFPELRSQGGK